MTRLLIDCTETLAKPLNTGIQRVVRQMIGGALRIGDKADYEIVPVVAVNGRFHALDESGYEALFAPIHSGDHLTPDGRLRLIAKRLVEHAFLIYRMLQRAELSRILKSKASQYRAEPVRWSAADCVLLIDTFWGGSSALTAARRARAQDVRVVTMIQDIIPLTHPEFMSVTLRRAFSSNFRKALSLSHMILVSAKANKDIVSHYCRSFGLKARIAHVYLGSDLPCSAESAGGKLELGSSGADGRTYVILGTIEPRKGHHIVVRAFEQLWAEGHQETLVIVGKIGWNVDELVAHLRSHPELGRKLHLVHDASDGEVGSILEKADAAIIASTVEGFGLPLVEALGRGLPVIASNLPVFQEIAGEAALYFQEGDADGLARAILRSAEIDAELRLAARNFKWPKWDDAVCNLLATISNPDRSWTDVLP